MTAMESSAATTRLASWRRAAFVAVIAPSLAMAFQVGTGGEHTENYYKNRGAKGYTFASYQPFEEFSGALLAPPLTAAQHLAKLREDAKLSVTQLASLLNVSRQTLYDWQRGAQPSTLHATKLERMSYVADLLLAASIPLQQQTFNRRLPGGKTILESVCSGTSPESIVQSFLAVSSKEASQRSLIKERLANRKDRQTPVFGEAGIPFFDENV